MAKKRMVSNQIVDSDDFLEMPLSAQALYLHLLVRADDEGFTNGVKRVMRMIGSREDDLKILIGKKFVIMFESGVVVIKHWLIHNTIRADRLIPTVHDYEKGQLSIEDNKAYTKGLEQPTDKCQHRLDKISLEEIRLDKINIKDSVEPSPTLPYQTIISYLNQQVGTNYKATSASTQKLIKARFNEGFTEKDFHKVIDNKCTTWLKTDMSKYLRPQTLFGTKFESYLNEQQNNNESYEAHATYEE